MVLATRALFVRLHARPGEGDAVEDYLVWVWLLVEQEPRTKPWLAVRFDASTFGVLVVFPDDEARRIHLAGPAGRELRERAERFASPPQFADLEVITGKL